MNITIRNGRCFRNPAFTSWGLVVYPIIYKVYDHPRRLAGTPKPKQGSTLRVSRLISEGRNSWNTGSPVSTSCTSLTYHGPPGLVWNLGFFAMDRCLKENLKISKDPGDPRFAEKELHSAKPLGFLPSFFGVGVSILPGICFVYIMCCCLL